MLQWHKILAVFVPSVVESVCTMFLVLLGCGSTITWPHLETGPTVTSVALCFGFVYACLVNISTCFSGGFFNPAITSALMLNKTLSVARAFCYTAAQVVGALIGAGLLYVVVPYENHGLLGVTHTMPVSPLVGFGVELLMTFVVTLTVLTSSEGGHRTVDQSASVVIGLAVSVCHLFGYPVSGCGINPARSFGPAAVMNEWRDHWVYWFGPVIGALLAAGTYHLTNNFPVKTADGLVVTGKELHKMAAASPLFELSKMENHPPIRVNMHTQTPYELKTTV